MLLIICDGAYYDVARSQTCPETWVLSPISEFFFIKLAISHVDCHWIKLAIQNIPDLPVSKAIR